MLALPATETANLIVRPYTLADGEARRLLAGDTFGKLPTVDRNATWLQWTLLAYRELDSLDQPPYGDYAVTLKSTGEYIGSVGLVPSIVPWGVFPAYRAPNTPPHFFTSPEFGLFWAIHSSQRGKGYAAEAAQVIVTHLFEVLNAQRVVATTEQDNAPSQAVMRKLGMRVLVNPLREPEWFQVIGILNNPKSLI